MIHQILEKMEWRCKIQSKKLRKVLEGNGTAPSERWIQVHLPSVDEHAVHPTGDVSFDVLLVLIKQSMLTNFLPVSYKWFCC